MDIRYPIGQFVFPPSVDAHQLNAWIDEMDALPDQLRSIVEPLSEERLDIPYRAHGWTIRQVVHHLADSHLHAYVRVKLALTENNPTVKPYLEDLWNETPEVADFPVGYSLVLLDALHHRWVSLLRRLEPADFQRTFFHPERNERLSLAYITGMYAWHGRHHLGHIEWGVQGSAARKG
jgi:hypothetical protein